MHRVGVDPGGADAREAGPVLSASSGLRQSLAAGVPDFLGVAIRFTQGRGGHTPTAP